MFNGKVALVTGAGSGIGRALAHALCAAGARVVLVGRRRAALEETAALCGGRGIVQACDLAQDADIDGLAGTLDRLDMLVHNAALYERGTVESAPVAAFDAHYAINVRAPFLLTQRVLPLLQAAQGEIAFVNSTVVGGHAPAPELAQYSATKQALLGLANSLRAEVNPHGIRVLSVFVGRTATPMQERAARDTGNAYQPEKLLQPDDVASAILHAFTLPRTAEITDLTIRPRQK